MTVILTVLGDIFAAIAGSLLKKKEEKIKK